MLDHLEALVKAAKKRGADEVEAMAYQGESLSVSCRNQKIETIESSESMRVSLRVIRDQRQACVTTNQLTPDTREVLSDQVMAMVDSLSPNPLCALATPEQITQDFPDLDLYDPTQLSLDGMKEQALACEACAMDVPRVVHSEGAEATWGTTRFFMHASNGFSAAHQSSVSSLSTAVLAEEKGDKQIDGYSASAVFVQDLESPGSVGRLAGERAARKLAPRKVQTIRVPVFFDRLISGHLLGLFSNAISGETLVQGTSFLKDKLGKLIFPDSVQVIDDPLRSRGLGSRPHDGEGLAVSVCSVVKDGLLATWLLNLRTARRLGLAPTGHGSPGFGGTSGVSTSNFYMAPGQQTPEDLITSVNQGFYVTHIMGLHSAVNMTTGDYSVGASGLWIDRGGLSHPVDEVTISGNLLTMFSVMRPANDLVFCASTTAPTLGVGVMTVAGR